MKPTLIVKGRFSLADNPVWSADRNSLFWLVIEGKTLNEFYWENGKLVKLSLPQRMVVLAEAGYEKLILGLQEGTGYLTHCNQLTSNLDFCSKDLFQIFI